MTNCIFCKLVDGSIPTKIVYQDEDIFVFNDINPKAEVHLLIIPKRHIESMLQLTDADEKLMGKMMITANKLALLHGLNKGYKTQINTGLGGGQEVFHLHIHVFGNRSE
ncbi:MAG: histidine triad nucleotide-binding protein [Neisseriales bacterium]|nr:MAG: histidine triad nucleotide-binding protein [Neisseriales bacterium]